MRATGASFARALADAQARGYAEADPSFDVEGIDSAHKLTIMSAIASERWKLGAVTMTEVALMRPRATRSRIAALTPAEMP